MRHVSRRLHANSWSAFIPESSVWPASPHTRAQHGGQPPESTSTDLPRSTEHQPTTQRQVCTLKTFNKLTLRGIYWLPLVVWFFTPLQYSDLTCCHVIYQILPYSTLWWLKQWHVVGKSHAKKKQKAMLSNTLIFRIKYLCCTLTQVNTAFWHCHMTFLTIFAIVRHVEWNVCMMSVACNLPPSGQGATIGKNSQLCLAIIVDDTHLCRALFKFAFSHCFLFSLEPTYLCILLQTVSLL